MSQDLTIEEAIIGKATRLSNLISMSEILELTNPQFGQIMQSSFTKIAEPHVIFPPSFSAHWFKSPHSLKNLIYGYIHRVHLSAFVVFTY